MEESRFFKNIWRFNAIVICVAGVLAILTLLFSICMIYKEFSRARHAREIVNINPETNIKEVFRLGQIESVNGASSAIIPLYSDQDYSRGYSGTKSTSSTRNLMFSNFKTGSNNWIFPNNSYLITSHELVTESRLYNKGNPVLCVLYYVVKSDSNGDTKLTEADATTIAISNPDGTNYSELVSDVKDVLGYEVVDKTTIAILFSKAGGGIMQYIDLASFKKLKELEVTVPNQKI